MQRGLWHMLMVVLAGTAGARTVVYEVEPVKAVWSAQADPEEGVSEVITLNVDTLKHVDLFVGNQGTLPLFLLTVLAMNVGWLHAEDGASCCCRDTASCHPARQPSGRRVLW